MPRGRHRFSAPARRLIAPVAVAVVPLGCVAAAWLVVDPASDADDTGKLRWLVAGAAAVAVLGAALLRHWDRTARLRLAEAQGLQSRAEARYEERVAELQADLEESRKVRGDLDKRLRARITELARMRSEHAMLLRRYATAETERASVLESRRLLAIEGREQPKALPAAGADRSASGAPTAATYLRASVALRNLADNAVRQGRGQGQAHTQAEGSEEHFDYFGHAKPSGQAGPGPAEPPPAEDEGEPAAAEDDLADVVGPEMLAEADAASEDPSDGGTPDGDAPDGDPADEDASGKDASGKDASGKDASAEDTPPQPDKPGMGRVINLAS